MPFFQFTKDIFPPFQNLDHYTITELQTEPVVAATWGRRGDGRSFSKVQRRTPDSLGTQCTSP